MWKAGKRLVHAMLFWWFAAPIIWFFTGLWIH